MGKACCECAHCGEHNEHNNEKIGYISVIIGVILFISGIFTSSKFSFLLFLVAYLLIGWDILFNAFKNILKGKVFDENFLMSVATIGAFAIGEYPEGVAVMLFFKIGEFFEELALDKSQKSIEKLMDIRPDYANLKVGDEYKKVSPQEVKIGETIIVKPGEKIPLDGLVIKGFSTIDTSALTGESLPRDSKIGDEVLSGSLNLNGLLTLKVTKNFENSTASKILDLVKNASERKTKTETFISKFAKYYTPIIVFSAIFLAVLPPMVLQENFSDWIHRALIFLVVSCPCALVISIPLSYFGGIGACSRQGILVKGSNYLDTLNHISQVVFDKTGTLTKGKFSVVNVKAENGFSDEEILKFAVSVEKFSNHPIAKSICEYYTGEIEDAEDIKEIAGQGISAIIDNKKVIIGKIKPNEIVIKNVATNVFVTVDGVFAGYISVSDTLKNDSQRTISELKKLKIRPVMLTGDNEKVAKNISESLGIESYYANLLPNDKVKIFEEICKLPGGVVFIGDGINDAPVLARADVGIAMGGFGSDAAIESADIVFMTDEPSKILTSFKISSKTRAIVLQNICLALGVKFIILLLGVFGIATMWMAVFGDVGVAFIAILNSMRCLKVKI
jgi:Cd2+/Zn2+-exporting ATPase